MPVGPALPPPNAVMGSIGPDAPCSNMYERGARGSRRALTATTREHVHVHVIDRGTADRQRTVGCAFASTKSATRVGFDVVSWNSFGPMKTSKRAW